ncbi:hypothetical protein Anapl_08505 [Anas platyrhynchos]|uniref:Uncharacterized protein n=1 Tax=Anas platyrhynchos TaxID=8839 RepID=R0M5N0_ANAPL|nr:hypothetical protein Anapl_08505 [Anas platyrhynchos]
MKGHSGESMDIPGHPEAGTAELAMSRACTIATSFHGLLSILSKNTLSISENLNSIPPPDYQIPAFTAGDEKSPYIYWTLKRIYSLYHHCRQKVTKDVSWLGKDDSKELCTV